jgi:hypothetical protein
LLVAQLWGARLQVNLFAVTLHTGNVMLGPLVTNEAFTARGNSAHGPLSAASV